MKQVILYLGMAFFLVACETGTRYEKDTATASSTMDRGTKDSTILELIDAEEPVEALYDNAKLPCVTDVQENVYASKEFRGGMLSDGLNIKSIRKGTHDNYERLVFDVQAWRAYGSREAQNVESVGTYQVRYNPSKKLLSVVLNGYRSFTASLPTFSKESVIEKIYFDPYKEDSAYKFYIQLKENTEVKVFDLKNPARMVFDIKSI